MKLHYRLPFSLLILYCFTFFLFISCKEPVEVFPPKGDDGQVFAVDVEDSKIPYLVIDTKGAAIPYEPRVPADLKIYSEKKLVQTQRIDIEFRGKTSFRLSDKKGYNFETIDASGESVDVSFFGFPEEEDWRLIGHVVNLTDKYIFDRTLMYNYVGYELSRRIDKYASRCQFVEIEVNGEYQGVYVFMEKLKRDRNRIDVKSLNASSSNITGGYILTIDKASVGDAGIGLPLSYFYGNWDDDARYTVENSFRSQYDINGQAFDFPPYLPPYHDRQYLETYFLYEYPKDRNITPLQKSYISSYIHDFETALLNDDFSGDSRSYLDYIELDSFVDYFLINELCRNVDAYRLSTYLQKDRNGKLAMGPVWDMNIGFDIGDRIPLTDWVINYNQHVSRDPWMMPFWWPRLMQDPIFRSAVKQRWQSIRQDQWRNRSLEDLVDNTAEYLISNGAVSRNYAKWDQGIGVDYEASIQNLKTYLLQRASWMDGVIGGF